MLLANKASSGVQATCVVRGSYPSSGSQQRGTRDCGRDNLPKGDRTV